jgi:hypothetical protein
LSIAEELTGLAIVDLARTAADQSLTDWGSGKRSPNFTIEMTGASDDFFDSTGCQQSGRHR